MHFTKTILFVFKRNPIWIYVLLLLFIIIINLFSNAGQVLYTKIIYMTIYNSAYIGSETTDVDLQAKKQKSKNLKN